MTTLETRSFQIRAEVTDPDARTVTGIGVPWDTQADVGSFTEAFKRGSVDDTGALLLFGHDTMQVVGKVLEAKDTEHGRHIRASFVETPKGDEVRTLAREGLLQFSIGFVPVEQEEDKDGNILRTKVRAKEYSLVPFGAYLGASVLAVRSETNNVREEDEQERSDMTEIVTRADIEELRETIEETNRKFSTIQIVEPAPVADTRSAGEVLKAIVAGDTVTIDRYESQKRAFTGGSTADGIVKDAWVGSLVNVFDASSGVLSASFSTGTLPSTGLSIEYAQLKANTIRVEEQEAEYDDLPMGKVELETLTAPVKTYGGGFELSRQAIERSSVNVLQTSLEALAQAAGVRKKVVLRSAFDAAVTAQTAVADNGGVVALGATLAGGNAGHWEDALIDAAVKFESTGLNLERLIVSASVFKKLRGLTVSGERVFRVGVENSSGSLNLAGLRGDLAGIPVVLDTGKSGDMAVFVNGRAIRQYDSALVHLSDENIVNLSKQYSVYRYGAVAVELPHGIVPVKLGS